MVHVAWRNAGGGNLPGDRDALVARGRPVGVAVEVFNDDSGEPHRAAGARPLVAHLGVERAQTLDHQIGRAVVDDDDEDGGHSVKFLMMVIAAGVCSNTCFNSVDKCDRVRAICICDLTLASNSFAAKGLTR